MKVLRSDCCEQPMRAKGAPDFIKDRKGVTYYHICIKCKEPCNAIEIEVEERDED